MTDECISTVEYTTSVTLKMNNTSKQDKLYDIDHDDDTVGSHDIGSDVSSDRPDALGLGREEKKKNGVHPKINNNL